MENFKIMYHKYPSLKIKVKSKFYYFNRNFESFDKLSDDRRNELIEIANELKDRYIGNDSFKTETIITEQFGFYDTELIDFERVFAKRFNKSNSSVLIKKLGKKS